VDGINGGGGKKYHENNGWKIKEKLTVGTGECGRTIKLKQTPWK